MFQLHDTTRRRLCVAGFLMLGVLPALLIGGWCIRPSIPGYVDAEAKQLGQRIGLTVKLGGLKHLRPGIVLYERPEAADPETGQTILRCEWLEVERRQPRNAQGQNRPTLIVTASHPEAAAALLPRIWQCLERTLEDTYGPLEADVQFATNELTLHAVGQVGNLSHDSQNPNSNNGPLPKGEGTFASHDSQTLTDVRGWIEALPGGTHAQIDFRLAGVATPEPIRLRVVRNRQASPPTTGFALDTGGGELPCNVLAMGLPALKPLGPRCRFYGYFCADQTLNGWQGEAFGKLIDLDLDRLVSDRYPHKLTGSAEVTIQSARFLSGRLTEGSVVVVAGPGLIGRSLVAAAVEHLGLTPTTEADSESGLTPYDQLAFSATLDAQGLHLGGRCTTPERTVLSRGGRSLLGEPLQHPSPAVALVRALVPQSAVQVPASRQTDWLIQHLPVPEVMPLPGREAVPPNARVRLRDTWER